MHGAHPSPDGCFLRNSNTIRPDPVLQCRAEIAPIRAANFAAQLLIAHRSLLIAASLSTFSFPLFTVLSGGNAMAASQSHTFQAEIKQLLHILVHSLYKDRDIFLRELISNASDALNKVQFELLTKRDVLDPDIELGIEIIPDPDRKTLRIIDTGIGMTSEEMIENLGVIAHSGAVEFLERVQ